MTHRPGLGYRFARHVRVTLNDVATGIGYVVILGCVGLALVWAIGETQEWLFR